MGLEDFEDYIDAHSSVWAAYTQRMIHHLENIDGESFSQRMIQCLASQLYELAVKNTYERVAATLANEDQTKWQTYLQKEPILESFETELSK